MSSGFSGSSTRSLEGLEREIEYRLGQRSHLDLFTDEFDGPGASEGAPGSDRSKPGFKADPHTDNDQAHDDSRNHGPQRAMAAAGKASEQEALDQMDREEFLRQAEVKKPKDQFPGSCLRAESIHRAVESKLARKV